MYFLYVLHCECTHTPSQAGIPFNLFRLVCFCFVLPLSFELEVHAFCSATLAVKLVLVLSLVANSETDGNLISLKLW